LTLMLVLVLARLLVRLLVLVRLLLVVVAHRPAVLVLYQCPHTNPM